MTERTSAAPADLLAGSCAEALRERTAMTWRHASNCVLLAVVTSPDLAADLIDQAVDYAREANRRSASEHER